jgi:hypothetical protein
MRVDGPKGSLAFGNMQSRSIKGTTAWQNYEVVLDVPPQATGIAFGILMSGTGSVWINSVKMDVVGTNIPTTDMRYSLAPAPANLALEGSATGAPVQAIEMAAALYKPTGRNFPDFVNAAWQKILTCGNPDCGKTHEYGGTICCFITARPPPRHGSFAYAARFVVPLAVPGGGPLIGVHFWSDYRPRYGERVLATASEGGRGPDAL